MLSYTFGNPIAITHPKDVETSVDLPESSRTRRDAEVADRILENSDLMDMLRERMSDDFGDYGSEVPKDSANEGAKSLRVARSTGTIGRKAAKPSRRYWTTGMGYYNPYSYNYPQYGRYYGYWRRAVAPGRRMGVSGRRQMSDSSGLLRKKSKKSKSKKSGRKLYGYGYGYGYRPSYYGGYGRYGMYRKGPGKNFRQAPKPGAFRGFTKGHMTPGGWRQAPGDGDEDDAFRQAPPGDGDEDDAFRQAPPADGDDEDAFRQAPADGEEPDETFRQAEPGADGEEPGDEFRQAPPGDGDDEDTFRQAPAGDDGDAPDGDGDEAFRQAEPPADGDEPETFRQAGGGGASVGGGGGGAGGYFRQAKNPRVFRQGEPKPSGCGPPPDGAFRSVPGGFGGPGGFRTAPRF